VADGEVVADHGFLFQALREWVACGMDETVEGITVQLDDSRSEWEKASMTLSLDGRNVLSQLTVWDSGEVEVQRADAKTGGVQSEHCQIVVAEDLRQMLDKLLRWQAGGGERKL
jgi:hypothetical protein